MIVDLHTIRRCYENDYDDDDDDHKVRRLLFLNQNGPNGMRSEQLLEEKTSEVLPGAV